MPDPVSWLNRRRRRRCRNGPEGAAGRDMGHRFQHIRPSPRNCMIGQNEVGGERYGTPVVPYLFVAAALHDRAEKGWAARDMGHRLCHIFSPSFGWCGK
jgi:hypothetical protein